MYEGATLAKLATHRTLPCNRRRITPGDSVTYYAQSFPIAKSPCKFRSCRRSARRLQLCAVELLDNLEHRGEVLLAQPAARSGRVELAGERRRREADARLARLL